MEKNYFKLLCIVGFVALATYSCWATATSLHLLLSSLPVIFCWIVAILFFIIASYGTKEIVDSLNQNIYLEKRGLHLVRGIIVVILFWLVCSMPTNTHTFFYRSVINNKVTNDIKITEGYLGQIANNTKNEEQAQLKIDELTNKVNIALDELEKEIQSGVLPGFGPQSKKNLQNIAKILGVDQIEPVNFKPATMQQRDALCKEYRKRILTLLDTKTKNIRAQILSPNPDNLKEVEKCIKNLELMSQYIKEKKINLNKAADVTGNNGVCDILDEGYMAIHNNQNYVNFSSDADKALYCADNPVTKVRRLVSVFDVWKDYLKGEYKGYGFIFWIILSILVDIGAFMFFDLAFRKTED